MIMLLVVENVSMETDLIAYKISIISVTTLISCLFKIICVHIFICVHTYVHVKMYVYMC